MQQNSTSLHSHHLNDTYIYFVYFLADGIHMVTIYECYPGDDPLWWTLVSSCHVNKYDGWLNIQTKIRALIQYKDVILPL